MPISQPILGEPRKQSMNRRVTAFREMNRAGTTYFSRYVRVGRGSYEVTNHEGDLRNIDASEVPAYVVGHLDAYHGMADQVRDSIAACLSDPQVKDGDALIQSVMTRLYSRIGTHYESAAAYFASQDADEEELPLAS